jgi:hypothetical protein
LFLELIFFIFERPLHVAKASAALGGVCTAPSFFEACPYTWKC